MKHAIFGGSTANFWVNCSASILKGGKKPEETEAMREGTLAHKVAEEFLLTVFAGGELKAPRPSAVPMEKHGYDYAQFCLKHVRNGSTVAIEKKVSLNFDMYGYADFICKTGNELVIIDYKYGSGVPVHATNNWQCTFYAAAALNEYSEDIKEIYFKIYQPRINNISSAAYTAEELRLKKQQLLNAAQKIRDNIYEEKAGAHCKFCPHRLTCDAFITARREKVQSRIFNKLGVI